MARTGRPRSYDEQEVIERACILFWSRGYHATSVQDLVDDLALQRASLYNAFGDKHSLYLRALSHYVRENLEKLKTALRSGPVPPAAPRRPPTRAGGTGVPGRPQPGGCRVANTTPELAPGDDAAK